AFSHRVRGGSKPIHVANVNRAGKINFEKLLHLGIVLRGAPLSISLIYQELMIVERGYFADAGAGGKQIRILVDASTTIPVYGHDTQQIGSLSSRRCVLNERLLYDAHEGLPVRSDGQAFHAFVGDTSACIS